jgi:hypothetical protein
MLWAGVTTAVAFSAFTLWEWRNVGSLPAFARPGTDGLAAAYLVVAGFGLAMVAVGLVWDRWERSNPRRMVPAIGPHG